MARRKNMDLNTDASVPYARGSDTSMAAAQSIQGDAARLRALVFEAIHKTGVDGLTCDGAEALLALSHQTCSPRFWELHKAGLIVDSGRRRKTRSNRTAVVYVATQAPSPRR
jgi:hypothetical protein